MAKRSTLISATVAAAVLAALLGRAVTVHSVGPTPLIYRVIANNNDLDSVQGLAPPGRTVELWYRQRNFIEGDLIPGSTDPFSWCGWTNDGTEPTDVVDVDQNGLDTTLPGFVPGQRVTWKCGSGGTAVCPSVAIHDASTAIAADPEYPFLLGTIQAHRDGGSFIAAAAIPRGQPLGFAVTVN